MWDISDKARTALSTSRKQTSVLQLLDRHLVYMQDIPLSNGDVSIDGTTPIRRTSSVTLQNYEDFDLLNPRLSNHFRLVSRIVFADGTYEDVPLGTFVPGVPRITDGAKGPMVTVDGIDTSMWARRYGYSWTFQSGNTYLSNVIDTVLRNVFSGISQSIAPWISWSIEGTVAMTTDVTMGGDPNRRPWDDVRDIAFASGQDAYSDRMGVLTTTGMFDPRKITNVTTFVEGENCTVTDMALSYDIDSVNNRVSVEGSGVYNTAAFASAQDNDSQSSTWVGGYFGVRTKTYQNMWISDTAQATAIARLLLSQELGQYGAIELNIAPDPSLDVNDVIEVHRERMGVADLYVIEKLSIPLNLTGMSVQARRLVMT